MKLPLLVRSALGVVGVVALGALAGCATETTSPLAEETASPAEVPAVPVVATHAAAATASLKTLARLVTSQKTLGFASASEAESASLVAPLPMWMVGLNDLRTFHPGDDPRPLLKDEGSFLYPVTAGGDVRSAMVVRKVNGEWKATQFGRASLARFAHEGRRRVSEARGVEASGVALVEIPTMSARLLAHDEHGIPMLTALVDVPGTDVRAGTTVPAAEVFAKLQPIAARNDGTAPN
jgi:hypothetical protein